MLAEGNRLTSKLKLLSMNYFYTGKLSQEKLGGGVSFWGASIEYSHSLSTFLCFNNSNVFIWGGFEIVKPL